MSVIAQDRGDHFLLCEAEPPDDIVAAMRAEELPPRVRWMTGSLIHRTEDGERVGHGILTKDPWASAGERRSHVPVVCRSIEEAPGAVADGLEQLERESGVEHG